MLFQVLRSFKAKLYNPGDVVIGRGTFSEGIYFIVEGEIAMSGREPKYLFRTLQDRSYFGEFCLLQNKNSAINFL